ncbi:MAG: glycine cleavage system aminomethyltransferase GcvT [Brooklawnia sp.]|uniref:glycine cleavage system aminomethyltransferase GcvT n=1 Tax=Brooklawnia sp. TaxID=2699740 RepID=UPI003C71ACA8
MSEQSLHQSPLHVRHEAAGAKMSEFGGWLMPLEYGDGGVLAEHAAVREAVGIFDVSHLGKLRVSGPGAADYLNRQLSNDLAKIGPGRAQYHLLCNATGGVVDDMIAYLVSDDEVLLIPNAANSATVAALLAEQAPPGVQVTNLHHDLAVIAVQGPRSDELLAWLGVPTQMGYMGFERLDEQTTVCRTGYTGERGCELVIPSRDADGWWQRLLDAGARFGVRACGLGARDTLRTEMGYALHGHELSPQIDPVSAGVSWAVGWDKPEFAGREALLAIREAGPARRSRGIRATERGIPRPGMEVVAPDDTVIGVVTSGTFSPTLRVGIGLALVDADHRPGSAVSVRVRRRLEEFELVKPPFMASRVRQ